MDFDAITIDTSIFEAYGAELENGILNSINCYPGYYRKRDTGSLN